MSPYVILVYGPAGCGKTTLVWKFSEWLRSELRTRVATVNLDAAVLKIPYKPVFDLRSKVTVTELMSKYGLGPNGAIIKAVEEAEKRLPELLNVVRRDSYEYVLIDTPGIMEVFTGREVGKRIVEEISRSLPVIGVFVMDSSIVKSASEYVYFKSLFVLSSLKLGLRSLPVWSKASMQSDRFKGLASMSEEELMSELRSEGGVYTEASEELATILHRLGHAVREIKVDSLNAEGFDDLFSALHETFCVCGDLT